MLHLLNLIHSVVAKKIFVSVPIFDIFAHQRARKEEGAQLAKSGNTARGFLTFLRHARQHQTKLDSIPFPSEVHVGKYEFEQHNKNWYFLIFGFLNLHFLGQNRQNGLELGWLPGGDDSTSTYSS